MHGSWHLGICAHHVMGKGAKFGEVISSMVLASPTSHDVLITVVQNATSSASDVGSRT